MWNPGSQWTCSRSSARHRRWAQTSPPHPGWRHGIPTLELSPLPHWLGCVRGNDGLAMGGPLQAHCEHFVPSRCCFRRWCPPSFSGGSGSLREATGAGRTYQLHTCSPKRAFNTLSPPRISSHYRRRSPQLLCTRYSTKQQEG